VGAEKSRLDFDVGELKLDKETLTEQMNALIRADTGLEFSWVSDAYLDANPELVRTMSVEPPRGVGDIRMVRIPHVDYQPCGGTHVHRVSEIGRVRVSKIENKGKQNRRVHLQFDSA
jgi:misacylated tRNA(Ala) deacylase